MGVGEGGNGSFLIEVEGPRDLGDTSVKNGDGVGIGDEIGSIVRGGGSEGLMEGKRGLSESIRTIDWSSVWVDVWSTWSPDWSFSGKNMSLVRGPCRA